MIHNDIIHKLLRKPLFIAGSAIAVLFILLCVFGPAISPNDPLKTNIEKSLAPPGGEYPLGCDELGRCILSRLISGARITLCAAIVTEAAILVIGILTGVIAGYFGGIADTIMVIIIDILLAFPGIILALVISGLLGSGLKNLLIALIAVYWVEHARIARSVTRFVKEKEFILAARALGCGNLRIIGVHILPNILPNMLVYSALNISSVIMSISSLSFIGLGVRPPAPEWGMLLSEGRVYMRENPLMIIAAIMCIVLSSACAQMLGESFRDILNPRQSHLNNHQKSGRINIKNIKIETIKKITNDDTHTLLSVAGLTICFPSPHGVTRVLENFNLELAEGQTLGIMGPSGCGKTVFCSSLLGMVERPGYIETGTIRYAPDSSTPIDLISLSEKEWRGIRGKHISMIFQNPMQALNHSRTIEKQFVEAILAHKTMKGNECIEFAEHLLEEAMLDDPKRIMRCFPFELSGGMAQRVMIAMSLAHDPKLLIADEPTTSLDRKNEVQIVKLFEKIRAAHNMAILFVSHDEAVIGEVCDRKVFMDIYHTQNGIPS